MGADLYIRRISDEAQAIWRPLFDTAVAIRDSNGSRMATRDRVTSPDQIDPDLVRNLKGMAEPLNDAELNTAIRELDIVLADREKFKEPAEEPDMWGGGTSTVLRGQAATQAIVELMFDRMNGKGYFRDSYNASSVLNRLGLSWWRDVTPMLTKGKGELKGKKLKTFRDMVANATLKEATREELAGSGAAVDDGSNSVEAWNQSYLDHRDRLLAFLDEAIALKEPIDCSL